MPANESEYTVSQKDNPDLIYKYSNFVDTQSLRSSEKHTRFLKILDETPTMGVDASTKGPRGLYSRGRNFDVRHLDRFIRSDANVRQSS